MQSFISSLRKVTISEIESNVAFYRTGKQLQAMSYRLAALAYNLEYPVKKTISLQESLKDSIQLLKQLVAIKYMIEDAVLECKNNFAQTIDTCDPYPRRWLITWNDRTLSSIFLDPSKIEAKDDDIATLREANGFQERYEIIYALLGDIIRHFNHVYKSLDNITPLNTSDLSTIPDPTIQSNYLPPRLI